MRATSSHPTNTLVAFLLGSLVAVTPTTAAPSDEKPTTTTTATPCMASSTSGAFYDLRPDIAVKPAADGSKPPFYGMPEDDYHARGWDYGRNFTLNICEPVVTPPESVIGVKEELWRNISAYYTSKGDTYSLGLQSGNLTARGKELVLQYTGGSPCGKKKKRSVSGVSGVGGVSAARSRRGAVHAGAAWKDYESDEEERDDEYEQTGSKDRTEEDTAETLREKADDDDDDDDDNQYDRRKSATIFFSCDKDSLTEFATASFIATDPEECHYIFKVKSQHACAGAEPHKPGSVGPGPVFLIILVIAVLVYLLGGIFYNRTVSNARGWKQLPNYSLWASVWSFITVGFPSHPIHSISFHSRLFP